MTTEIRVTASGPLGDSDVQATIALTRKIGSHEDPSRIAEELRTEAENLLNPRRQIGPAA